MELQLGDIGRNGGFFIVTLLLQIVVFRSDIEYYKIVLVHMDISTELKWQGSVEG